jgi:hypothetical protein
MDKQEFIRMNAIICSLWDINIIGVQNEYTKVTSGDYSTGDTGNFLHAYKTGYIRIFTSVHNTTCVGKFFIVNMERKETPLSACL